MDMRTTGTQPATRHTSPIVADVNALTVSPVV
jgi:hypothetical protein